MTTATPAADDINSVIIAAVNARIEAAVAGAMVGDEGMGRLVTAALQQQIEVKDGSSYRTKKVTFLSETVRRTIQSVTEEAVKEVVESQKAIIQERVREALLGGVDEFAKGITESFIKQSTSGYGMRVSIRYPGMEDESW